MRFDRLFVLSVIMFTLAACGRQDNASSLPNAPAVAPITDNQGALDKHYTQSDFDAACFPYPTQQIMLQYHQLAHLNGQDAIDYEYRQLAKRFPVPPGECEIKKEAAQHPQSQAIKSSPGQWVESAPANDMAHYGDGLPHGKN